MRNLQFGIVGMFGLFTVAFLVLRMASGVGTAGPIDRVVSSADPSREYSKSGYELQGLSEEPGTDELAEDLSADERRILLAEGTEPAFSGNLLKNKRAGLYACRLCGLPLFASEAKFRSGSGWPSFSAPMDVDHVYYQVDRSMGVFRTEIECTRCRSHLGHVFEDGPRPTGLRYCVNSASLRFYALKEERPPESQPIELDTAYFAGGCFWGVEDRFEQVPGVLNAVSGYMGGSARKPSYKKVCSGRTGHAETVKVSYNPKQVSYRELLEWFFRFHDATQLNRQGPDVGTQYRSAIFTVDDVQLAAAKAYIKELQATDEYKNSKIVTQVKQGGRFHEAEAYHQDYHARHGGSCALPKKN